MAAAASDQAQTDTGDYRAQLRSHPFFSHLDDSVFERLFSRAIKRKVKKGTVLFRKGDAGSSLYAVCTGTVRISAPSEQGKDAVFNLISPGEIFGEIALLDGGQRTADAVAVEASELMVLERREVIPLLREHPEFAMKLIEMLCSRLRRTSEQVEDILFLGMSSRLAKALLHLHRQSSGASPVKKISITQREISQMIGVSRESANKQLRDWERRKWLKLERGGVIILAPSALKELAAGGD